MTTKIYMIRLFAIEKVFEKDQQKKKRILCRNIIASDIKYTQKVRYRMHFSFIRMQY